MMMTMIKRLLDLFSEKPNRPDLIAIGIMAGQKKYRFVRQHENG